MSQVPPELLAKLRQSQLDGEWQGKLALQVLLPFSNLCEQYMAGETSLERVHAFGAPVEVCLAAQIAAFLAANGTPKQMQREVFNIWVRTKLAPAFEKVISS